MRSFSFLLCIGERSNIIIKAVLPSYCFVSLYLIFYLPSALKKSEAEIPRESLTYMNSAIAFRGWDSFWDLHCEFIAILYGSTPTIISLRLVSGTRWPRGFDRDTMQGALSVPVMSRCRSQRLSEISNYRIFLISSGPSVARAAFLSPVAVPRRPV